MSGGDPQESVVYSGLYLRASEAYTSQHIIDDMFLPIREKPRQKRDHLCPINKGSCSEVLGATVCWRQHLDSSAALTGDDAHLTVRRTL
jgi:hypothetical protein